MSLSFLPSTFTNFLMEAAGGGYLHDELPFTGKRRSGGLPSRKWNGHQAAERYVAGGWSPITALMPKCSETVIGPLPVAISLPQVTARLLGVRSIFTERENGKMDTVSFKIAPRVKRCLSEDIVTYRRLHQRSGDVNKAKGDIVGIGLCRPFRRQSRLRCSVRKRIPLPPSTVPTYKPEECPCAKLAQRITERGAAII